MNRRTRSLRIEQLEDRRNPTIIVAPPYELDPTFGEFGSSFIETDFGPIYGNVVDAEIDTDGRIWALGTLANNPVLARFLPDGTPDASFDGDGLVALAPWDESISSLYLGHLELLPDGRAVVAGTVSKNAFPIPLDGPPIDQTSVPSGPFRSDFVAIRLNKNGSLDTAFGDGGRAVLDLDADNPNGSVFTNLLAMELLDDGRIAVGGMVDSIYYGFPAVGESSLTIPPYPIPTGLAIARLTANGKLDTTYDGDGIVLATRREGNLETLQALTFREDGIATVLGTRGTADNMRTFATAYRFDTDGKPDASFDGDGYAEAKLAEATPIPDGTANVSASFGWAANQPGGGTVFGTVVFRSEYRTDSYFTNTGSDFTVVRFRDDGSIDPDFGTDGAILRPQTSYSGNTVSTTDPTRNAFALQTFADGSIAVLESTTVTSVYYPPVGDLSPVYGTPRAAVVLSRYDVAGRHLGNIYQGYDFTFRGSSQSVLPREVLFDDEGRLTAVGISDSSSVTGTRIGVSRYVPHNPPANELEQTILLSPGRGEVVAVQVDGSNPAVIGPGSRPFGLFDGQVQALLTDLDGDGTPEEIYGIGEGGGSTVLAYFHNADGSVETHEIVAFEDSFRGGVSIAAGDLDGDGKAELIVSAGNGGGGRLQIYSVFRTASAKRADFFGIEDENFRGGATTAIADVDGDGAPELLVAAGVGGGPRVAVFDGATLLSQAVGLAPPKLMNDFYAFGGEDAGRMRNGVTVSAADLNGDGRQDLIFGAGPGGARRVLGIDGAQFANGAISTVVNFYVGNDDTSRAGVEVSVKDVNQDGQPDLVVERGSQIRIYDGDQLDTGNGQEPGVLRDVIVFADGREGVFVG